MADYGQALTGGAGGATSGALLGSKLMPGWGTAIGGVLGGGLGMLGGLMGSNAAEDAAAQAAEGQRQALEFAKQQYAQGREDLNPYMQAGGDAVGRLGGIAGQAQPGFDYQQQEFSFDKNSDPGAQYLMSEIAKSINASSLAKGGMGGGLLKSLNTEMGNQANTAYQGAFGRHMATSQMLNDQAQQKYGRNLGWQQNQFGQQKGIADMGQGSAMGLAGMGQQLGQYGGNQLAGMGANRAAGTMGSNASMMGGVSSFANQLAQGLGGMFGGGGGAAGGQLAGQGVMDAYSSAPVYNF